MTASDRPAPAWRSPSLSIRIGISACLLGEPVRYDGGHKKDGYITGTLARHFDWVLESMASEARATLMVIPTSGRNIDPVAGRCTIQLVR